MRAGDLAPVASSVNSRISLIISLTAVRLDQANERRDELGTNVPVECEHVTGGGPRKVHIRLVVTVEQYGNTRLTMQIEEDSDSNQPPGSSLSIQKTAKICSDRYQYNSRVKSSILNYPSHVEITGNIHSPTSTLAFL